MPGYQSSVNGSRSAIIVVRVTPRQKAAWRKYLDEMGPDSNIGIGNLIRAAVEQYIREAPKNPGEREALYGK